MSYEVYMLIFVFGHAPISIPLITVLVLKLWPKYSTWFYISIGLGIPIFTSLWMWAIDKFVYPLVVQ